MTDPFSLLTLACGAIVALGLVSTALLRGWTGYLALRRMEIEAPTGEPRIGTTGSKELRELKERVRKLEAIASGVDL